MTATPHLTGPGDVAAAVPHLLGFHPQDSIVAVTLDKGTVRLVARCDAPEGADADWAASLAEVVSRAAPGGDAIILAFDSRLDTVLPLGVLADELRAVDIHVLDRLVVADGRWRSLECADTDCCPPSGHVVPPNEGTGRAAPARSRDAVVAELAAGSPDDRCRVVQLLESSAPVREAQRDAAIAHVEATLRTPRPSPDDIALALIGLRDIRVRDTVLWDLLDEEVGTWARFADTLASVVRVAPDDEVAPAATLLAVLRWQTGDGTRAVIALDRALAAEPGYTLASLVAALVSSGVDPRTWLADLRDMSREACRRPESPVERRGTPGV